MKDPVFFWALIRGEWQPVAYYESDLVPGMFFLSIIGRGAAFSEIQAYGPVVE